MFNRRYPYAGNVRSRTASAAERRTLQDSDYLHHRTWRRKNADAGVAGRCSGVYGKALQRRSIARECSGGSGKLSLLIEARSAQGGPSWELSQHSGPPIRAVFSADSSRSSVTVLLWNRCSNRSSRSRLRIPPFLSREKQPPASS